MKFHCVLLQGVEVSTPVPTKTEIRTLGVWRDDLLTMRTEAEIDTASEAEILEMGKEFLSTNLWYVGSVEGASIPTDGFLFADQDSTEIQY